jgi:hypothetical protein
MLQAACGTSGAHVGISCMIASTINANLLLLRKAHRAGQRISLCSHDHLEHGKRTSKGYRVGLDQSKIET